MWLSCIDCRQSSINFAVTQLSQIFEPSSIVRCLVRTRLKEAARRRSDFFRAKLGERTIAPSLSASAFDGVYPPRRQWPKPTKCERDEALRAGRNSNEAALHRFMCRALRPTSRDGAQQWTQSLRDLVERIRARGLGQDEHGIEFASPKVQAYLKKELPNGNKEYRCVTSFPPEDNLLISLFARYFRYLSDPLFAASALAFRTGSGATPPPQHHDAIRRLEQVRVAAASEGKALWVAEVDIRGFFDTIRHDRLLDRIKRTFGSAGIQIDPRAQDALLAYLAAFTFNGYGQEECRAEARKKYGLAEGMIIVPHPLSAEELGSEDPIGVPQGGALSCWFANILLADADDAVEQVLANDPHSLYMRYCDDIIILSSRRDQCRRAMDVYLRSVKEVGLRTHKPLEYDQVYLTLRLPKPKGPRKARPQSSAAEFWSGKSKAPYRWANPRIAEGVYRSRTVPWCSFLGYQLRYDGLLRIRLSSIQKEIHKHQAVVLSCLREFKRDKSRGRVFQRQAIYRFRQRLRSASVGTTALHRGQGRSWISWAGGFRVLSETRALRTQLRLLDRHKSRAIYRFKLGLKERGVKRGRRPTRNGRVGKEHDRHNSMLSFEGRPYSYRAIADRPRSL